MRSLTIWSINGYIEEMPQAKRRSPAERRSDPGAPAAVSPVQVVDWLRDRIRTGRLVPGQRLVEADLVRETGATRSRVREALQRLGSEGLLRIEEFRGASVRRFSRDELQALYRVRSVLEGLAALDFANAASDGLKQRLKNTQADMDTAVIQGDHDAFARANDNWHSIIIEGGENEYVAQMVDRLRVPVSRLLFATFHSRQRIDRANADHQAITRAILEGRGEEAERRMRRHIEAGFAALAAHGVEG